MNTSESIQKLLRGGIANLSFGMNPQGQPYCQAEQNISTGAEGNITRIQHQKTGANIGVCLDALSVDIEHCAKLFVKPKEPSNIVQVRGNSN